MINENRISIVIPVYNGSPHLRDLIYQCKLSALPKNYTLGEIILVNDSSKDRSWELIKDLTIENPGYITGVNLNRNYGQHAATLCGLQLAQYEYVITIDDDLEMNPLEFAKLIEKLESEQCDLVYGINRSKNEGIKKKIGTLAFKLIQKIEGNEKGKGSSFRILSRNLVDEVKHYNKCFAFIDEMLLWHTDRIGFVEVDPGPNQTRESRYNLNRLMNLGIDLIIFSSNTPLRLMTILGFLGSFFSISYMLILLYRYFMKGVPVQGYTSLMSAILITGSIIMFCLGVVGEYLNKVYRMQKNEPLYGIREIIGKKNTNGNQQIQY
jgi:glycosyltransferase involved in cell wall biosynthesis